MRQMTAVISPYPPWGSTRERQQCSFPSRTPWGLDQGIA